MRSPIFGPYEVSRSTNASDNQLINLYPEIIETKQGKAVGALYSTPGLDLLTTIDGGPIRNIHSVGNTLYVVSGGALYSLDESYNATLLGGLPLTGDVSAIDNGNQIAVFVGNIGVVAPIGYFLIAGLIGSGGEGYSIGDQVVLRADDGIQVATAIISVLTVSAGAVTGIVVTQTGSFPEKPTGFTQSSTTGSGSGLTISSPVYTVTKEIFQINLPYSNTEKSIRCAYQDGFGVINQPGSNLWFQSDLLDLSIWNPLNFASASGDPDDVLAIAMIHREMWLIKQFETEVWYNAGTVGFTFARLEGVYLQGGIIAVNSLAQSNEVLIWLSQTKTGDGIVVQSSGHSLRRISTHAIEVQIQKATPEEREAATAWVYQQQGHEFYIINVNDQTWVYDITDSEKAGIPLWHQRSSVPDPNSGVGPPRPPWNLAHVEIILEDATVVSEASTTVPCMTPYDNPTLLGNLSGGSVTDGSIAFACSSDGLTVVGQTDGAADGLDHAVIWTSGGLPDDSQLPPLVPGDTTLARAISKDGLTVVGTSGNTAVVWNSGTVTSLGFLPGGNNSSALGVTDGGIIIVGSSNGTGAGPVVWESNVISTLPLPAGGYTSGGANGVSADGSVICGQVIIGFNQTTVRAVYWTKVLGVWVVTLLDALGTNFTVSYDTSSSIVVGASDSNTTYPVYWEVGSTAIHTLPGSSSANGNFGTTGAAGISTDGKYIVGAVHNDTGIEIPCIWTNFEITLLSPVGDGSPYDAPIQGNGVSDDGCVVVGQGARFITPPLNQAFAWGR